jgi:hypothetical protein
VNIFSTIRCALECLFGWLQIPNFPLRTAPQPEGGFLIYYQIIMARIYEAKNIT